MVTMQKKYEPKYLLRCFVVHVMNLFEQRCLCAVFGQKYLNLIIIFVWCVTQPISTHMNLGS